MHTGTGYNMKVKFEIIIKATQLQEAKTATERLLEESGQIAGKGVTVTAYSFVKVLPMHKLRPYMAGLQKSVNEILRLSSWLTTFLGVPSKS